MNLQEQLDALMLDLKRHGDKPFSMGQVDESRRIMSEVKEIKAKIRRDENNK